MVLVPHSLVSSDPRSRVGTRQLDCKNRSSANEQFKPWKYDGSRPTSMFKLASMLN